MRAHLPQDMLSLWSSAGPQATDFQMATMRTGARILLFQDVEPAGCSVECVALCACMIVLTAR